MNIFKSSALFAGAFSLAVPLAQAQDPNVVTNALDLNFRDIKNFKMVGPNESEYLGGELNIFVRDGFATFLPCANNFSIFYSTPNILCPTGTTGLVTAGDVDGDGVRDVGFYLAIAQPFPARNIEPFRPERVELYAAPPSDLPRPLGAFNWVDDSAVIF